MKLLFAILSVSILIVTGVKDYCRLCPDHVACNKKNEFASKCVNPKMVELNKGLFVDEHNKKRNLVAGGGVAKLKPACRMATMTWDDELAFLASYNVKQCDMKHDTCYPTEKFPHSGQNLALHSDKNNIEQAAVNMWYGEVKTCEQQDIDSFPEWNRGFHIGHFTVMVRQENNHLGCAAAEYDSNGYRQYLIACNYASTNMMGGFPVYNSCSKATTGCKSGTNSQYPNLCSTSEMYKLNGWINNELFRKENVFENVLSGWPQNGISYEC
uniref:SCP domain-containing protein n=1 Tax=Glossina brevipalpis TaxID=37001 RepID=A0A1A9W9C0_9MUSC